jgi:hypothetical protein
MIQEMEQGMVGYDVWNNNQWYWTWFDVKCVLKTNGIQVMV